MRFLTAGESHGQALITVIEGFPAQVKIEEEFINRELSRRQKGYGRGGRMRIEGDKMEILSGVRRGRTLGAPISFKIANKDWENWSEVMSPFNEEVNRDVEIKADRRLSSVRAEVTAPRPGHADLPGALKYGFSDLRNIIERASARETAARVGVGAFARLFLAEFGVRIGSHVLQIGEAGHGEARALSPEEEKLVEESPLRCLDPKVTGEMVKAIDRAGAEGETLGGVFLVYAKGVPPGLGSHVHWDRRLDGRLAQAVISIPGIKGVEIGAGFAAARKAGSAVHDPIFYLPGRGFYRESNNAGGIEGGISNGESLILKAAMKPIPTLYKGLPTVDLKTREPVRAAVERSDLTAVPAAAVVAEAMVAWVLADSFLEKFGGDSLPAIKRAWKEYTEELEWKPREI